MKQSILLTCMVTAMMTCSCVLDPPPPECTGDYHPISDGSCELNSKAPDACGYPEVNCLELQGIREAKCLEGQCSATACEVGFHLIPIAKSDRKECTNDTMTDCGQDLQDCNTVRGAQKAECKEGVCVADSCKTGFFKRNGVCLPDNVTQCGSDKIDCQTKFSHYREISCDNNQCVVYSCEPGYHINNNDCEKDTTD
ncbi:MAG: hypothetical protein J6A01_00555 [Proteobacteria bacterium]|nr:hypothetical protein [Pseudomonadota bacterium]